MKTNYKIAEWIKIATTYDLKIATLKQLDFVVKHYLLTPWSRVLLEKLTGSAASQEIPRIFGTRRYRTHKRPLMGIS